MGLKIIGCYHFLFSLPTQNLEWILLVKKKSVIMIFQATLGGKMKGRSVQYHSNISKDEGRVFYEKFITLCEVFLC